jgi:Flp pilus assembly protein TadG
MRATRSNPTPQHRHHRPFDDTGAALVEFALVFPLLVVMMLGIVTGGLTYNQKLQVTHAVREGARYGATIPAGQNWTGSGTWASNVRDLVIERSAGDLTGAQVCVALVENTSATTTVVVSATGKPQANFTTNTDASPCYTEAYPQFNSNDNGRRVQVRATRPAVIDLAFSRIDIQLVGQATARAEFSE